jgi:hypothetical protein
MPNTKLLMTFPVTATSHTLDEYRARGGYATLAKALTQMSPEEVTKEVLASGIQGRGGAAFPMGRKWGVVNLDDALFLYWLIRQLKPRTIVQTGVCNGLSAAFMMLALAKNGPDGTLHVIDLPPVFDPKDPAWTEPGKIYGVVIPEGRTTGWLVPDAYRDRFEVWNGDAKDLLPRFRLELIPREPFVWTDGQLA